jgi:hypothetical protein
MSKIGQFFSRVLHPGRKKQEQQPAPAAPVETSTRSYTFPKDSVFIHGLQVVEGRFPSGDMAPGTIQTGPPVMPPELSESVELKSGFTISEDPKKRTVTITDTRNGGEPLVLGNTRMSVNKDNQEVTLTNDALIQELHHDGSFLVSYPSYYISIAVDRNGNASGTYNYSGYAGNHVPTEATMSDKGVLSFKWGNISPGTADYRMKPFITYAQLNRV